jgi:hypothetical protein
VRADESSADIMLGAARSTPFVAHTCSAMRRMRGGVK